MFLTSNSIMKRNKFLLAILFAPLFAACFGEDTHIDVDPSQIHGKWIKVGSQEYWRYYASGNGATWDESEGKTEETTNLTYTWQLDRDELTHWFRGEQENQMVPKVYTIKEITSISMKWKDNYGITSTYTKVD